VVLKYHGLHISHLVQMEFLVLVIRYQCASRFFICFKYYIYILFFSDEQEMEIETYRRRQHHYHSATLIRKGKRFSINNGGMNSVYACIE